MTFYILDVHEKRGDPHTRLRIHHSLLVGVTFRAAALRQTRTALIEHNP